MDSPQHQENKEGFTLVYTLAQVAGAIAIVLIIVWTDHYRDGFAWRSRPDLQFNWHPLLMTVGMIFLLGNGIMIYRAFPNYRKRYLKLMHAMMHNVAFIMAVIGLQAVFDSHNLHDPPIPNVYSLHSWIGLTAVILFACQFVTGFITFFFPGLKSFLRAAYMPIHVYFGNMAFICSVVAALLGLSEKAFFVIKEYANLPPEAFVVNFIGVVLVVFAGLVMFIMTESKYKRQPRPEDEILLTGGGLD